MKVKKTKPHTIHLATYCDNPGEFTYSKLKSSKPYPTADLALAQLIKLNNFVGCEPLGPSAIIKHKTALIIVAKSGSGQGSGCVVLTFSKKKFPEDEFVKILRSNDIDYYDELDEDDNPDEWVAELLRKVPSSRYCPDDVPKYDPHPQATE